MILAPEEFAEVVRRTPLVSIDLLVRDREGRVLVGWRRNAPARDCWFVPGGRICKDERVEAAFRRITRDELGVELELREARPVGVFEHLYPENFAGRTGFGTHYVVLAYEIDAPIPLAELPDTQHGSYRWLAPAALLAAGDVHPHTKDYFREAPPAVLRDAGARSPR